MLSLLFSSDPTPPSIPEPVGTAAEIALAAARTMLDASRADHLAEVEACHRAAKLAREAETKVATSRGFAAPSFLAVVRSRDTAHSALEELGDRIDRAAHAVAAAQHALELAEQDVARETIARLDQENRAETECIFEEVYAVARQAVARIDAMVLKANQAAELEATLPGYVAPTPGQWSGLARGCPLLVERLVGRTTPTAQVLVATVDHARLLDTQVSRATRAT
jgi:hypothetical protein